MKIFQIVLPVLVALSTPLSLGAAVIHGIAIKTTINVGSKSQHEVLAIQTQSEMIPLAFEGTSPFGYPPQLEFAVGKAIKAKGDFFRGQFIVRSTHDVAIYLGSPSQSQAERWIRGHIIRKVINRGSKSEREALVIQSPKGEFPIDLESNPNPYEVPQEIMGLEGRSVFLKGTIYQGQILVHQVRVMSCSDLLTNKTE